MNIKYGVMLITITTISSLICMETDDAFPLLQNHIPVPVAIHFGDLISNNALCLRKLVAQEQAGKICHDLFIAENALHRGMKGIERVMLDQCKEETAQFVRYIAEKSKKYQQLIAAIDAGNSERITTIIASNCFVVNSYGSPSVYRDRLITPLHYVLCKASEDQQFNEKSCEYARILLCAGAKPNARDDADNTPMHHAVTPEHVRLLWEFGAENNTCGALHYSPLLNHIRLQHWEIAQLLIDSDADVNIQDQEGNTPLHEAVTKDSPEIVELLLTKNANYTLQNEKYETPVDKAIDKPAIQSIFCHYLYVKLCRALKENNEDLVVSIVKEHRRLLPLPSILDWAKEFYPDNKESINAMELLLSDNASQYVPREVRNWLRYNERIYLLVS